MMVGVFPSYAAQAASNAVTTESQAPSFWRKVLDGANVTGKFKTWKAGDTRAEFSALLNSVSTALTLFGMSAFAFVYHTQREMRQAKAATRELVKINEYKEVKITPLNHCLTQNFV